MTGLLVVCATREQAEKCAASIRERGYAHRVEVRYSPGRFGAWGVYRAAKQAEGAEHEPVQAHRFRGLSWRCDECGATQEHENHRQAEGGQA